MKQFQAGCIADGLIDVFEKKTAQRDAFIALANWTSFFTVQSNSNFEASEIEYPSNIALLINLLQRGAPTRLNKFAIDFLINKSDFLEINEENESAIVVQLKNTSSQLKELIFRSLHLIEPRLDLKSQTANYEKSWENLDSIYEESFLYETLPNFLGANGPAFTQLIATQRSITSIIKEIKKLDTIPADVRTNFNNQRSDFSIQFPYNKDKTKGIIIEIDGPQHDEPAQTHLDIDRDHAVAMAGWHKTLRIKTAEFANNQCHNKIRNILLPAISNAYVKNCISNFTQPLWSTPEGKELFQLCLIPFAVARLQRVILEAVAKEVLNPDATAWKIAVVERDVPCAKLALDDLHMLTSKLNALSHEALKLPKINLSIFSTHEFIDSKFQAENAKHLSELSNAENFDLLIDISLLQRFSNSRNIPANASELITIRSIHYIDAERQTKTSASINYKPFCHNLNESGVWVVDDYNAAESLEYLLQSIFRKKKFREGQLPILHNALQCKSVIGLLPTGGGKSLTYQLSALMQPGICLVVDPIRSLMKDQVDGLNKNNIDACIYINSTLQGEEKQKALRKMAAGEAQFIFISPERLQMEEFRGLLADMHDNGLYFSYCVIDEAHCVSEWGHDFRTAYLRLGENAIKNCKTKNLDHIPLFGLTATASYDVLADVQRELSGNDEGNRLAEDAIIRSEYSKRNELQFIIEEVSYATHALNDIWGLKKELSDRKFDRINTLLTNIPTTLQNLLNTPTDIFREDQWNLNEDGVHEAFNRLQINDYNPNHFFNGNANAGLIFCPHTQGAFGVTDKFKTLTDGFKAVKNGLFDKLENRESINAGFFIGSGSDAETGGKKQEESFVYQDKFINNELNLMVATKAFGMGIDKENIRYTIHLNYPGSIESYIQEAGRAGRDGKLAIAYILFNDQKTELPSEDHPIDHDLDINLYFHKNSFKGIAKELAVVDELLTEIYFPDRTFELESLINSEFDINIKCNYWEGGKAKNLYFELGFNEPMGYFDLNTLTGFTNYTKKDGTTVKSLHPEISERIWILLKNYIHSLNLDEPVHQWLLKSDKKIGIEKILDSGIEGEEFKIVVGFHNNTKYRISTITDWLKKVVHPFFNEKTVQMMRSNCTDAEAFIEEVCIKYENFTRGNKLDFESICAQRDKAKNNPIGTAFRMFMALYNGYRDKMDTEKAIYRLSTLGTIDDYTVNFSSQTFTLSGRKKTAAEYNKNLLNYLLKYYSEKTAKTKLLALDNIDEPTAIRKALNFLVNFVYNEIQKKRRFAIHDMKNACRIGLENGAVELKEYIDLYFNSKYARTGYSYTNELGVEVNASLPEITDNGKNDDLDWVWLFMDIVDEDPKAGQIDNIKHLRGACTRMLNNQPESYTLLLLSAFTLYMLEYKNPRFLREAEDILFNAFTSIQEKEPLWSDKKIEKVYNKFKELMRDKNGELESFMEMYGFSFDYDAIMIKRLLEPLKTANSNLSKLNKILN